MPYDDPEKQRKAMREIMRRYRSRRKRKKKFLERAIQQGRIDVARVILDMKPSEVPTAYELIFGRTQREPKKPRKRR
jgi:hypothetical protein